MPSSRRALAAVCAAIDASHLAKPRVELHARYGQYYRRREPRLAPCGWRAVSQALELNTLPEQLRTAALLYGPAHRHTVNGRKRTSFLQVASEGDTIPANLFNLRASTPLMLVRHGDVLVQRAKALPKSAHKRPGLILAHGEATGHSHRIKERGAACLYSSSSGLFLEVTADKATLVHDEHKPIELPKGVYRVWRQREYFPGFIRIVGD